MYCRILFLSSFLLMTMTALAQNFGLTSHIGESDLPYSKARVEWPKRIPKKPYSVNNLSLRWELADADLVMSTGGNIFCKDYDTSQWYDAVVPGTVLATLVSEGVYPDPYFGVNNMEIPEELCRKDWWYRTEFQLTDVQKEAETLELLFNGINYMADIWLNGVKLGNIKGAFVRGRFDITDIVRDDNILAVHIYPPHNPGIPHEQSSRTGRGPNGGQLCLDGPTFISSEGWDWVPGVRDRNIGIWQDVEIIATNGIKFGDIKVVTDLPLPDVSVADVTVCAEIVNTTEVDNNVIIEGEFDGLTFMRMYEVPASSEKTIILSSSEIPELKLENPKLWMPNGYGEQNMYSLKLQCVIDGKKSDFKEVRFGVRELSYELTVDMPSSVGRRIEYSPTDIMCGKPLFDNTVLRDVGDGVCVPSLVSGVDEKIFHFIEDDGMSPYLVLKVNGKRIYCRGGNWGMDDMMKNTSREHLEPYFKLHKEAGFNMIRNWTGESTEETFYSLCDEYGMLVWNDFWISTEGYNLEPNDDDLFIDNVRDVVKRFRNHPSIAIWCPRNEGYAPESLEFRIAQLLAEEDGTRYYQSNSRYCNLRPSGPWHYYRDASVYYTNDAKGFNTELGSPSVPTASSMRRFLAVEDQWPISEAWHYHDLHPETAPYVAAVSELYGEPEGLDDFCRKVQLINYDSYRAMFESWNSRLWNNTSGLLLWMSHPAWPSVEWQVYSWDCETHGSYFGSKKACESLHPQMNLDDRQITVLNISPEKVAGMSLSMKVYDLKGKMLSKSEIKDISVDAGFRKDLDLFAPSSLSGTFIIRLELKSGRKLLSVNDYICRGNDTEDFTALNALNDCWLSVSEPESCDGKEVIEVKNHSGQVAVAVKLTAVDPDNGEQILPAYFSDGYFNLLPGEVRKIETGIGKKARIAVEGYNVKYSVL